MYRKDFAHLIPNVEAPQKPMPSIDYTKLNATMLDEEA